LIFLFFSVCRYIQTRLIKLFVKDEHYKQIQTKNMTSIFDLKTNPNELSSANEGTSRMMYEQHPPTRDITGKNFPNGAIHIRFQTSGQKWWLPSRSYIRMRARLSKSDGTTLEINDDVAPNMGLMSNLFQSSEFRIADKVVSRVSDYMPQIDSLETRLSKSKSWIESIGASTNWWQDEQKERQKQVVSYPQLVQVEDVKTRLELGFNPLQQFAMGITGILTQSVNTDVDLTTVFVVGDEIEIDLGTGPVRLQVIVVAANTIQTQYTSATVAVGASVKVFSRIRSVNGKEARALNEFEMTWQPPLSIFKIGHALPSGKYELVLNPQTASQYKKRAIESLLGDKVPTSNDVDNDFQFAVVDMYLYIATVDGPRGDDQTYLLDLEETRCQVDSIDGGGGFQQKNFDVSPSTFALTCAFQDTRSGNLTQYSASKFKINGAVQDELRLNRMFLNYAGQNRPAPDADPTFVAGNDYTIQRYVESQLYSGAYYDCGGAESVEEWHERGAYYYFSWPRDGTDRSTRVNAHFGFNGAVVNGRVLIFDHSKKIARVSVQDGRVVDVQVEDA
jgi:hypothetical protein